jgi:ectoine hydroxylase-related dioxygenase (phytanoyl-CoA dioxygenase family)
VPGVLRAAQVAELRAFFRPEFDVPLDQRFLGDAESILFDVFNHYKEARWLLFHEPSIKILKSLLGEDYVVLREASIHYNNFGDWHKDTSSQEKVGHFFHRNDDYLMVEMAYYLQDNTEEYGGGLDVEPGSHREPDLFLKPRAKIYDTWEQSIVNRAWRKVAGNKSGLVKNFVSVPSKAGDLVIFDFRINHRGSQPRRLAEAKERGKLAIFLACSRNNAHVQAYHDFIHSRPDYKYLKNFSYNPELLQQAQATGLNLV